MATVRSVSPIPGIPASASATMAGVTLLAAAVAGAGADPERCGTPPLDADGLPRSISTALGIPNVDSSPAGNFGMMNLDEDVIPPSATAPVQNTESRIRSALASRFPQSVGEESPSDRKATEEFNQALSNLTGNKVVTSATAADFPGELSPSNSAELFRAESAPSVENQMARWSERFNTLAESPSPLAAGPSGQHISQPGTPPIASSASTPGKVTSQPPDPRWVSQQIAKQLSLLQNQRERGEHQQVEHLGGSQEAGGAAGTSPRPLMSNEFHVLSLMQNLMKKTTGVAHSTTELPSESLEAGIRSARKSNLSFQHQSAFGIGKGPAAAAAHQRSNTHGSLNKVIRKVAEEDHSPNVGAGADRSGSEAIPKAHTTTVLNFTDHGISQSSSWNSNQDAQEAADRPLCLSESHLSLLAEYSRAKQSRPDQRAAAQKKKKGHQPRRVSPASQGGNRRVEEGYNSEPDANGGEALYAGPHQNYHLHQPYQIANFQPQFSGTNAQGAIQTPYAQQQAQNYQQQQQQHHLQQPNPISYLQQQQQHSQNNNLYPADQYQQYPHLQHGQQEMHHSAFRNSNAAHPPHSHLQSPQGGAGRGAKISPHFQQSAQGQQNMQARAISNHNQGQQQVQAPKAQPQPQAQPQKQGQEVESNSEGEGAGGGQTKKKRVRVRLVWGPCGHKQSKRLRFKQGMGHYVCMSCKKKWKSTTDGKILDDDGGYIGSLLEMQQAAAEAASTGSETATPLIGMSGGAVPPPQAEAAGEAAEEKPGSDAE